MFGSYLLAKKITNNEGTQSLQRSIYGWVTVATSYNVVSIHKIFWQETLILINVILFTSIVINSI